jgi:hypothetical protein
LIILPPVTTLLVYGKFAALKALYPCELLLINWYCYCFAEIIAYYYAEEIGPLPSLDIFKLFGTPKKLYLFEFRDCWD